MGGIFLFFTTREFQSRQLSKVVDLPFSNAHNGGLSIVVLFVFLIFLGSLLLRLLRQVTRGFQANGHSLAPLSRPRRGVTFARPTKGRYSPISINRSARANESSVHLFPALFARDRVRAVRETARGAQKKKDHQLVRHN